MDTVIQIKKTSLFAGPRKVGLDSDCIIHLIHDRILYRDLISEIKSVIGVLHIHPESEKEVPKVLERDYKYSPQDAQNKFIEFKKEFNLICVQRIPGNPLSYKLCQNIKGMHPPDSWILADFKTAGINKVYSGNDHIRNGCLFLGIECEKVQSVDKAISQKLKNLYRRK